MTQSPNDSIVPAWTSRRLLHIALLLPAFLLSSIKGCEAAGLVATILLLEVFLLPEWLDPSESDGSEAAGSHDCRVGIILYPVALLALVVVFNHDLAVVAAAWALLALGDGLAGAVGEAWGQHRLPFNREKTWEGFAAFVVFGAPGAMLLMRWVGGDRLDLKRAVICLSAALVGAVVESLPIRLSDNITMPLVCGGFIYCAALIERAALDRNLPYLGVRVVLALSVNLILALLAFRLRQATGSGAVVGLVLGAAVYMAFGYKSFLILFCFLVLGTGATHLGYTRKLKRGIAERRRGARSWREATANLLAPAFFSVLVITTPFQWAFLLALIAALAEGAGDTVSSEIGKWLSPRAYLITTLRPVKAGENGGISLIGTAAGFAASTLVVLVALALGLCGGWGAAVVLAAALIGNSADSLIGATLEHRGLVTNGIVNFMGTSLAGTLALLFALHGW